MLMTESTESCVAELEELLELSPQAALCTDEQWRIVRLNTEAARLLQLDAAALRGADVRAVLPDASLSAVVSMLKQVSTTVPAVSAGGVTVKRRAAGGYAIYFELGRRTDRSSGRQEIGRALLTNLTEECARLTDPHELVRSCCHLAVPRFADSAAVHLLDDAGELQLAAAAPAGTTMEPSVQHRAVLSGRRSSIGASGRDSKIVVPLMVNRQPRGTFTLLQAAGKAQPFEESDVWHAEEAARRIGSALTQVELLQRVAHEEARYRSLVLATSDIVWATAADGQFVMEQPVWTAFTGQLEEQLGWGWLEAIHPDDRAETQGAWRRAIDEHELFTVEHRVRRVDGSWRHMAVRAAPVLDRNGELREWLGVHRDVHQQRMAEAKQAELFETLEENEEQLRELIEHMPELAWTAEADGSADFFNSRWTDYSGVDVELLLGRGWIETVEPSQRESVLAGWQTSMAAALPFEMEILLRARDGGFQWFLCRVRPLRDRQGRIAKWSGTCANIDEQKRTQRDLEAARAEAERANRLKDDFLATISHELRTPLQSILGWTSLLETEEVSEPRVAKGLEVIARNARAQAQLIEDILDTSRIIAGQLELNPAPVDLEHVVGAAADTLRHAAEAKGIALRVSCGPNLGTLVGDPARLQQVIWNLVSNAIKFTSEGSVEVTAERTADQVVISVRDTGSGIAPDFLPRVFERFRQADGTKSRRQGGLGLGLAIVRHLVELHGGEVSAHSEGEGKGAVFRVALPLAAAAPKAVAEDRVTGSFATTRPLDQRRVLVVDDEDDAREVVAAILQRAGAIVELRSDAAGGVEAVDAKRPDVLVSDIGMPGEDGHSLLRRLRAKEAAAGQRRLPALALTAYARQQDEQAALEAGFDRHLAKPVEPRDLVDALRALLDGAVG